MAGISNRFPLFCFSSQQPGLLIVHIDTRGIGQRALSRRVKSLRLELVHRAQLEGVVLAWLPRRVCIARSDPEASRFGAPCAKPQMQVYRPSTRPRRFDASPYARTYRSAFRQYRSRYVRR